MKKYIIAKTEAEADEIADGYANATSDAMVSVGELEPEEPTLHGSDAYHKAKKTLEELRNTQIVVADEVEYTPEVKAYKSKYWGKRLKV